MRLRPLYRLRLTFRERWSANVAGEEGQEDQVLTLAEGSTEGDVGGRFRATDYPRRRTDGTPILLECRGFGRRHTSKHDRLSGGPGQWVVGVTHLSDSSNYRWLNDAVWVGTGHSPQRTGPNQRESPEFVLDVAELVWEPLPE